MKALYPPSFILVLLLLAGFLTGCEKKEQPVVLPPLGTAVPGRVDMGGNYENQVFYDFATNRVVRTSQVAAWDLAFEAAPDGSHVFINGGKNIFIYNTHATSFGYYNSLPANVANSSSAWGFDAPCGLPDSTAVGEWMQNGTSKNEVYVLKMNDTTFKKIRLVLVNSQHYMLQYGDLADRDAKSIELVKDPAYNYIYFSFANGQVQPDPPKDDWDVVFTRYRHVYRDLNNMPYTVNGALLNPYYTTAGEDSTRTFEQITPTVAAGMTYSNFRDAIGYDWKSYNFNTGRYEVNRNKVFVIRTRNNEAYKLHFLDFYDFSGVKGSPSFEFERMQ